MKKRLISMLLLVVMVLGMLPATALAASSEEEALGEVNIYNGEQKLSYLSINGRIRELIYTYFNYVGANGKTKEIPAYCVNPNTTGVPQTVAPGESIKYMAKEKGSDPKVMGIIANGYPTRGLSELKLENKYHAYYATKMALWCYLLPNWNINNLKVNPNLTGTELQRAQAILAAAKDIYVRGTAWSKVYSPRVTATADRDTAYAVTVNGQQYKQQVFTVHSDTWVCNYAIRVSFSDPGSVPDGTRIVDMDNKDIATITTSGTGDGYGGKFKVLYPASAVAGKTGSVQLSFTTNVYKYLWNEARDQWLVDPEAAEVVKRIFAMTIEGYGPYQIASKLKSEKVLIPSAYLAQHGEGVNKNKTFKDVYGWGSSTICNILEKREYLGHTINFKTRKHFKDKKSHYVPEDEWTIFENTHEPIIDQQTFDLVQKIRGNVRRYPDGWGEAAPLTGLLYCADCGGKMYVHRTNNGKRISQYTCSQYSKVPVGKLCTTQHRINEDVVLSLVSEMLKAIAEYAKHDRAEFVRVVQEAQSSQQTAEVKKQRTRLATAKQRVSELEVLLCKIYEDNILGKLSDSRYATLDAQYEKEQTELTAEISALEKAVKSYEKHEKDADRFIALIDKYENFDKLTIAMLNEFIEKILVHERDRKGSIQTTQEVEIYFNFVGRFVPPAFGEVELTPEELEEIRKREERKDRLHQNYLKRKASGAQKRYEDKIKGRKKAEIEAKKAAIRAEDIAKGVFVPVSSLPQREPMKGVQTA